jgi:hypothetical protein
MTMSNAQTVSRSRVDPAIDMRPLDDALQSQLWWLDQVAALQSTWLTSVLAIQAECWRSWSTGDPQWPAWMVWHNGTEQLA